MADVSHELGSLRHIVDSPLSSKVAMFNKVADEHNSSQLLNPFSNRGVRGSSPGRPVFNKDEYGKPLAGSLTEMRGQKANIHVCKEMLELCQIIDSEGFPHPENPDLKVIFFGDLFNIYNHISDKCVGLLLRARKHKLVEFEGEMLFQRRDDEVPIITTKPLKEIRKYIEDKTEEFRRSVSPAPRATTIIQDNMKRAVSQTPSSSPLASKAGTPRSLSPQPDGKPEIEITNIIKPQPTLRQVHSTPDIKVCESACSDNNTAIELAKKLDEHKENEEQKNQANLDKKAESCNKVENKTEVEVEKKTEEKQSQVEETNNNCETKTESAPTKVTVYITKPPVIETSVVLEGKKATLENNTIEPNGEVKLENTIEAKDNSKENKEEILKENKQTMENIESENIESKSQNENEKPEIDSKVEMPNNIEELNGKSIINENTENSSSETIIKILPQESQISLGGDGVTEKVSEQAQNLSQSSETESQANKDPQ